MKLLCMQAFMAYSCQSNKWQVLSVSSKMLHQNQESENSRFTES